MNKTGRSRKWMWIGGGLIVALLVVAGLLFVRGRAARAQVAESPGEIVTAFVGDLATSATASGRVVASRQAALALASSGTVAEVMVAVGDAVPAGAPLLKLETADLERAVLSAQESLAIQEANLATLLAPVAAVDVAAVDAAVASAQAQLDALIAGPSAEEIASAEASVRAAQADVAAASARLNNLTAAASPDELRAAEIELELAQKKATQAAEQHSAILVTEPNEWLPAEQLADLEYAARVQAQQASATLAAAQETYDSLVQGDANAVASARASLSQAIAQRDAAQARLDLLLRPPTESELAAARANLAQAQASLDRTQRGPAEADVIRSEIALEQARLGLQRAEQNLGEATLLAPFAGVVTAVHVQPGETAGGVLVELIDPGSLEVVLDVDELVVADLYQGQPAIVTLEAWPDANIPAEILAITPQASAGGSALVTYTVYLGLGQIDRPLRVGMTANASLTTRQASGVLLLANAAISADRSTGTYSVNRVQRDANGNVTTTAVPVTIGLRDGPYTQITSGLQAGDEVMIGNALPVFRFGPGSGNGGSGPFGN